MKVVAFNASPRKNGNTYSIINMVFEELENRAGAAWWKSCKRLHRMQAMRCNEK